MVKNNSNNDIIYGDCLVSVIVPVYMTEEFLDECMKSLLEQTIKSYEIILINDGSKDKCPEICEKYVQNYSRVRIIHQENKGVSVARNVGISNAKGKYISFCDSDDKMTPNMLEELVKEAECNNADVVICGFETFPNGRVNLPTFPEGRTLTPNELINSCATIHSGNELCFSWRFLLKTAFLSDKQLFFDEKIKIGEDMLFNTRAVMEAKRISVLSKALYCYRINNENSIMGTKFKINLEKNLQLQYEEKMKITKKYGLDKNREWMRDLGYYYVTGFAGMLFKNAMNGPESERKKTISDVIRLPMIRENYKRCGGKIFNSGVKVTIFRLACIMKIDSVVYWFVNKWYR